MMRRAVEITREMFLTATGHEPQDDDLERCNCLQAGEPAHQFCGWNVKYDKPQFMVGVLNTKALGTNLIDDPTPSKVQS